MPKYLILICMLNLSFLSCQSKKHLPIEWQPSVNAPEFYPAFVYNGAILLKYFTYLRLNLED